MYRRSLLVAVAGCAGCAGAPFGGGDGSSLAGGDGTGEDERAGEPIGTATDAAPTASPTPDRRPDDTPSAAELERMDVEELLALARSRIDRAVDAYAGEGEPLTAVTAAADSFDPSEAIEQLYYARAAYEAADRQGITAEQVEAIRRLRQVEEFLRLAIDSQALLVAAHTDLGSLTEAIEYVDAETVRSIRDRVGSRHEQATDIVSRLSQTRYRRAVTVADRLSRDGYDAKRLQLETETELLQRLVVATAEVLEGVRLLSRARGKRQSGSPYAAASLGKDAERALGRGIAALDGVARNVPPQGRGFSGVIAELLTATEDRRAEARTLHETVG
jgi:hypothetical protein